MPSLRGVLKVLEGLLTSWPKSKTVLTEVRPREPFRPQEDPIARQRRIDREHDAADLEGLTSTVERGIKVLREYDHGTDTSPNTDKQYFSYLQDVLALTDEIVQFALQHRDFLDVAARSVNSFRDYVLPENGTIGKVEEIFAYLEGQSTAAIGKIALSPERRQTLEASHADNDQIFEYLGALRQFWQSHEIHSYSKNSGRFTHSAPWPKRRDSMENRYARLAAARQEWTARLDEMGAEYARANSQISGAVHESIKVAGQSLDHAMKFYGPIQGFQEMPAQNALKNILSVLGTQNLSLDSHEQTLVALSRAERDFAQRDLINRTTINTGYAQYQKAEGIIDSDATKKDSQLNYLSDSDVQQLRAATGQVRERYRKFYLDTETALQSAQKGLCELINRVVTNLGRNYATTEKAFVNLSILSAQYDVNLASLKHPADSSLVSGMDLGQYERFSAAMKTVTASLKPALQAMATLEDCFAFTGEPQAQVEYEFESSSAKRAAETILGNYTNIVRARSQISSRVVQQRSSLDTLEVNFDTASISELGQGLGEIVAAQLPQIHSAIRDNYVARAQRWLAQSEADSQKIKEQAEAQLNLLCRQATTYVRESATTLDNSQTRKGIASLRELLAYVKSQSSDVQPQPAVLEELNQQFTAITPQLSAVETLERVLGRIDTRNRVLGNVQLYLNNNNITHANIEMRNLQPATTDGLEAHLSRLDTTVQSRYQARMQESDPIHYVGMVASTYAAVASALASQVRPYLRAGFQFVDEGDVYAPTTLLAQAEELRDFQILCQQDRIGLDLSLSLTRSEMEQLRELKSACDNYSSSSADHLTKQRLDQRIEYLEGEKNRSDPGHSYFRGDLKAALDLIGGTDATRTSSDRRFALLGGNSQFAEIREQLAGYERIAVEQHGPNWRDSL